MNRVQSMSSSLTGWSRDAGRAWWLLAVAGPVLVLIWAAVPSSRAVVATTTNAIPVVAVSIAILRFHPVRAGAWALFGLGALILTLGLIPVEFPSMHVPIAQNQLLLSVALGQVIEIVGLAALITARGRLDRWAALDIAVLLLAVGLVVWFAIVAPVLQMGRLLDTALPPMLINSAISLALLGLVLRLLLAPGERRSTVWLLAVSAALAMFGLLAFPYGMAHGVFGDNEIADISILACGVGWGLAIIHPSMAGLAASPIRDSERVRPMRVVVLASAAMLAGPIALFLNPSARGLADFIVLVFGSTAMFGLIFLRLSKTLLELDRSHSVRDTLEVQLREQAELDSLTGLPNRATFGLALDGALRHDPLGVAVLFCDLDDFKTINDTLGHDFGDRLLIEVGARISATIRPPDVAARLGGDEFAILLRNIDQASQAVGVAERILASFGEPFALGGQTVSSRPSIGIALAEHGGDPNEAVRNADIAMYLAKSEGKGRYELFRTSLHAEVVSRLALRASLQRAVESEEFVVYYQPIVDLANGRTMALEALVRWNHPDRGIIQPVEFIPVAEATGQIVPLGRWVLRRACRDMAGFIASGTADGVVMTVNLSPTQLRHPDIIADIRDALASASLPASRLVLEVTEGVISDLELATTVLEAIHALGAGVAIDDFGTGYSALSYLSRFPINHIKIDRSFISAMGKSERETTLTSNVLHMANQLKLGTIAEGIETQAQLDALRSLGCTYGQGYLFSRPVPLDQIERHLRLEAGLPKMSPSGRSTHKTRAPLAVA